MSKEGLGGSLSSIEVIESAWDDSESLASSLAVIFDYCGLIRPTLTGVITGM